MTVLLTSSHSDGDAAAKWHLLRLDLTIIGPKGKNFSFLFLLSERVLHFWRERMEQRGGLGDVGDAVGESWLVGVWTQSYVCVEGNWTTKAQKGRSESLLHGIWRRYTRHRDKEF